MNVPRKARTAIGAVARRLWRQSGRGKILDVSSQPFFLLDEFEPVLSELELGGIPVPQAGDDLSFRNDPAQRIVRLSPFVVFDGGENPDLGALEPGAFSFVSSICGPLSGDGLPGKVVADFWRLLRPGGKFLVLTDTKGWKGGGNLSARNPAKYLRFLFHITGFSPVFVAGFDVTGLPRLLPGRLLGGLGYVLERGTLGLIFPNAGRFLMVWGEKPR